MTYAPADLLAIRLYLLSSTGLSGDAVGVVGDEAHDGGYHCGSDRTTSSDYSRRESARDRAGLTKGASAIDYGTFRRNAAGVWVSDRTVTAGLVAACQRNDPRARDIREIIYTPDGSTVRRFDRLGIRSTGDSSHLFHTHVSFFRDSEGRRAQPDNFLGLLRELIEGGDMSERLEWFADALEYGADAVRGGPIAGRGMWIVGALKRLEVQAAANEARDRAARAAIDALTEAVRAGGGSVESAAIIARMDAIAAAESTAVAALHAELVSARQEAQLLRERLAGALAPPAAP